MSDQIKTTMQEINEGLGFVLKLIGWVFLGVILAGLIAYNIFRYLF